MTGIAGRILLIFFLMSSFFCRAEDGNTLKITGHFRELKDNDTVLLIRYKYQFLTEDVNNEILAYGIVKNHQFSFKVNLSGIVEKCHIIFPEHLAKFNWMNGVLEKGGDLGLSEKSGRLYFSNKGANLIHYSKFLDSVYKSHMAFIDWQGNLMDRNMNTVKSAINSIVQRPAEKNSFAIMRMSKISSLLSVLYSISYNKGDSTSRLVMKSLDANLYKNYLMPLLGDKRILHAASFPALVNMRYKSLFESAGNKLNTEGFTHYIRYLKNSFKDPVLAQLVVAFLYNKRNSDQLTPEFVQKAITGMNTMPYKEILESIGKFAPGFVMPEFILQDTAGVNIGLRQFRENVLLMDFWFTGCLACVAAHKVVDSVLKEFVNEPLKVLSISKDDNSQMWKKSIYSGLYTSVSDINLSAGIKGETHPIFRYFIINSYPTFIIVGKDGKIIGSPVSPNIDKGSDLRSKLHRALEML